MSDWMFAQEHSSQELARLHLFSVKKKQGDRDIEFVITVREYATPPDGSLKYFAKADKQTNQSAAPYTPSGWGRDLLSALAECIRAVNRFPYEGD
ncbi:MAG: hypothetical protein KIT09_32030 [Bryobacteraceae bacterium]|nr:hypothetical protein [Bryobacteraceae bacterium]